jgi:hypothetical protein
MCACGWGVGGNDRDVPPATLKLLSFIRKRPMVGVSKVTGNGLNFPHGHWFFSFAKMPSMILGFTQPPIPQKSSWSIKKTSDLYLMPRMMARVFSTPYFLSLDARRSADEYLVWSHSAASIWSILYHTMHMLALLIKLAMAENFHI